MTSLSNRLGHYQILDTIGNGNFATVFRARNMLTQHVVALKVLHQHYLTDQSQVERFQREGRLMEALRHPHIVPVLEAGLADGRLFLALELLNGGTLASLIQQKKQVSYDEVLRIVHQLSSALDYIHKHNVIHRDLKPSNVLLDAHGKTYISDFGVSRLLDEQIVAGTSSLGIFGTASYAAPEIWTENNPSAQTDIYALACITYELLMGVPLFEKGPMAKMVRASIRGPQLPGVWPVGIPSAITSVLKKALAGDPKRRYKQATGFWEALNKASTEQPKLNIRSRPRRLPAVPPDNSSTHKEETIFVDPRLLVRERPRPSLRNPAIVIVEDEADILIILARLIRDVTSDYDIITVDGGASALAQIALRSVPLVITDYNMPGMNGLQLTAAIKETSPGTTVMLITAYHTPELKSRAQKQGVDYYYSKPFSIERFEQDVRDTLAKKAQDET